MIHAIWTTRSLRFWVAFGMALAILPLATSAVVGYLMLDREIIAAFQDVAARQRYQVEPTQRLSLLIWEALVPVDEFVDEGDPVLPAAYRSLRQRIEVGFVDVHDGLASDPEPRALTERARDDWTAADRIATEILSVRRPPGDPGGAKLMEQFHGLVAATIDRLGAVYIDLARDLRGDHDAAELARERSEWLAVIASIVSLVMIAAGSLTIGRMMSVSVDRLIEGATRFAAGDREHRIDIPVPPELRRVADGFNRMIVRIHEAEEALSDLARRDGLTRLLNRRAFDESLAEVFSRMQRFGEPVVLLMIDIDHFKRINDKYGHGIGDDVLRAVAQTMVADVRVLDRVFRVGGEEFAVLLPGAQAGAAKTTAERLREAIGAIRVPIEGGEISTTVSIGMAAAAKESDTSALVEVADAALYRAKMLGRNRIVVGGDDPASGSACA